MHLDLLTLLSLTLVGFFTGFIDSIAGGGGLIQVPVLLSVGLSPATTFGTNKLVSAIGEFSAILQYLKHNRLDFKRIGLGLVAVLISASVGAILVQIIHPKILEKIIPFLMLLVLIYFSLPQKKDKSKKPLMKERTFFIVFGFLIGFYNGFFGPATGTMWIAGLLFFLAFNLHEALIYTRPLNLAGNLISIVWFVIGGHIVYLIALFMGVGSFIGGRTGARFVMSHEVKFIRPVLIVIVAFMTVGLFFKYY